MKQSIPCPFREGAKNQKYTVLYTSSSCFHLFFVSPTGLNIQTSGNVGRTGTSPRTRTTRPKWPGSSCASPPPSAAATPQTKAGGEAAAGAGDSQQKPKKRISAGKKEKTTRWGRNQRLSGKIWQSLKHGSKPKIS